MSAEPRGFCVIVDNYIFDDEFTDNRNGTRKNAKRLSQVFTKLKFDVILKEDLTARDMNDLFNNISRRGELAKHDALVIIILSHGEDDIIYGRDFNISSRGYIRVKDVFEKFRDSNCPLLGGKPKLFIISACRGQKYDQYTTDSGEPIDEPLNDTIIFYSTRRGYVGFIDPDNGSVFGVALAQMLTKFQNLELRQIFDRVKESVSQSSGHVRKVGSKWALVHQNPQYIEHNFNKLYFNVSSNKEFKPNHSFYVQMDYSNTGADHSRKTANYVTENGHKMNVLEQKTRVEENKTHSAKKRDLVYEQMKCLPFDNNCDIKAQLRNSSDKENKSSTETIGQYCNSTQFHIQNQCFDYELKTQSNKFRPMR